MTTADRAAVAAAGSSGAQSRRAAGASVSPAGRRRHSGAQRSPLPIVPRAPTAFPSVAGQGGSEPPLRPSPSPTAPAAGEAGVASQRSRLEIGVAWCEPWSPGRWLHPSSLLAGCRDGLPPWGCRSLPPSFRPQLLPGGGFRGPLHRGEALRRLVGSCNVCGGAGVLFFTGRGDPD